MRQQQEQQSDMKQTVDGIWGLSQIASKFWHSIFTKGGSAGEKFFADRQAALCLAFIPLFGLFAGARTDKEMEPFVGLMIGYVFALLHHRLEHAKLAAKGYSPHSWFVGHSVFGETERAKSLYEPLTALAIGLVSIGYNHAFGLFCIVGAIALKAEYQFMVMMERSKLRQIRDARIEGEYLRGRIER